MKLNSNFLQGGGGCKTKNLPWGSLDVFCSCTLYFMDAGAPFLIGVLDQFVKS